MESLLTFGSYAIPNMCIEAGTYKVAPNRRQDLDTYRDADGILHRTALSHTATTIEFTTGYLYESEMNGLMAGLKSNYINYNERDANCTYYDPENNNFRSGHMYLDSNLQFGIHDIINGEKIYEPVKFSFVEY